MENSSMGEYKENTVGWWLSQLKEPLKSRALGSIGLGDSYHNEPCNSLTNALWRVAIPHEDEIRRFWIGACDFFDGLGNNDLSSVAQGGWYMAEKCAPDNWLKPKDGGEDKAIVDSPAPEIPVTGAMIEDFSKRVKWPITREIEAPERAVVGYEEPKPIDTIEKKHELKIQNLELAKYHQGKEIENLQARVEQLEGVVGKLEQQIEYVYRNLPKDFDGTR